MKPITKTLIWLTLFSIAMGYLETSVVVYLRNMYFASGYDVVVQPIPMKIAMTELWREIATIIMLIGAGVMAGKNGSQRFAFFIYCFAVWDIFYYVFLKVILDWPSSLLTWDLLFLIPVPWVGPVIAPVIVSLTMILFTLVIVYYQEKNLSTRIKPKEVWLMITGCLVVIFSFTWNFTTLLYEENPLAMAWASGAGTNQITGIIEAISRNFNWAMFLAGEVLLLATIALFARRMKNA
jgi:hypothetical protein